MAQMFSGPNLSKCWLGLEVDNTILKRRRVLSTCCIYIKIRSVLREIQSSEHEHHEFTKMEIALFIFHFSYL